MPELPEVETTRRSITPHLLGRRIRAVQTTAASYFFLTPPKELARRLTGRSVTALERHGKYLLARLDDDSRLFLHLGMTGQLFTASARSVRLLNASRRGADGAPRGRGGALVPEAQSGFTPDVHTHLVLDFDDGGERVLFRDVRKFGKVRWLAPGKGDARLTKLGIDALAIEGAHLFERARGRKAKVKTFLLDQSILAGVGNIYADEALFRAGVRPTRAAGSLNRAQYELIAQAVVQVLTRSIETGGSSISDYIRADGSDGGYQNERKVYARAGEACLSCGTPIKRLVLGQRSTHYCPTCQK